MRLTVRTAEEHVAAAEARFGPPRDERTVADLVRADVDARSGTPRWATLSRVRDVVGRMRPGDSAAAVADAVETTCRALESRGDLTVGDAAMLHPSPLRAVERAPDEYVLVTSLPTSTVAAILPGRVEARGTRRVLHAPTDVEPTLRAAVAAMGGRVLTPEAWARLDRTPPADQAWLDHLDARLAWVDADRDSFAGDGLLRWSAFVPSVGGPVWQHRGTAASRLWRARTALGYWRRAWTDAGRPPNEGAHLPLSADEANRTTFALACTSAHPVEARVARGRTTWTLRIAVWLPSAEYRFLDLHGVAVAEGGVACWTLPAAIAADVVERVVERLGLHVREAERG